MMRIVIDINTQQVLVESLVATSPVDQQETIARLEQQYQQAIQANHSLKAVIDVLEAQHRAAGATQDLTALERRAAIHIVPNDAD